MQNSLRYCQVGMDIGGTLTKIVCVIPNNTNKNDGDSVVGCLLKYGIVYKIIQSNLRTIYLFSLHTNSLSQTFWSSLSFHDSIKLFVTGGGAYRYEDDIKRITSCVTECKSIIKGFEFLLKMKMLRFGSYDVDDILIVNIGTGVSFLTMDGRRVGGTAIGGGTLLGLSKLVTGISDFDTIIKHATEYYQQHNERNESHTYVGDIYGTTVCPFENLKADTIASYFAATTDCPTKSVYYALIEMITYNISQLAILTAKNNKCMAIVCTGSYVNHTIIRNELKRNISRNSMGLFFTDYDGYMGALGCVPI